MVHRGAGSDDSPRHTTFNGTSWSCDTKLPAHYSLKGPGLARWWTTSWNRDERFPGHSSGAGPAVAAYRDVNAPAEEREAGTARAT
ncbi:hypothetical protein ACIRP7_19720 [Streptomyces sp. NPDC102270]|uniref:hypothetical protein n=1 Tax=Streptomyces sp. NPDC102270 TaxID=3366150 RepID=UPI003829E815